MEVCVLMTPTDTIRCAALELADGTTHIRVALDALRFACWRIRRQEFDAAVIAMTLAGAAALFPCDDRYALSIDSELQAAAIDLCGVPQHYLYLV